MLNFGILESPEIENFIAQLADNMRSTNTRDNRWLLQNVNDSFRISFGTTDGSSTASSACVDARAFAPGDPIIRGPTVFVAKTAVEL